MIGQQVQHYCYSRGKIIPIMAEIIDINTPKIKIQFKKPTGLWPTHKWIHMIECKELPKPVIRRSPTRKFIGWAWPSKSTTYHGFDQQGLSYCGRWTQKRGNFKSTSQTKQERMCRTCRKEVGIK